MHGGAHFKGEPAFFENGETFCKTLEERGAPGESPRAVSGHFVVHGYVINQLVFYELTNDVGIRAVGVNLNEVAQGFDILAYLFELRRKGDFSTGKNNGIQEAAAFFQKCQALQQQPFCFHHACGEPFR